MGSDTGGSQGASKSAPFITTTNDSALTGERRLTAGSGISIVDNGANSTLVISATGGGGGGTSVRGEALSGTINGSNVTFTISHTPATETLVIYLNGIALLETTHYSISGTTITLDEAPVSGDSLWADYEY